MSVGYDLQFRVFGRRRLSCSTWRPFLATDPRPTTIYIYCYGCGNSQNTIKVPRSVMPISLCSDRFPHRCSEGNIRVIRAVIFEIVFFFYYRYFGPTTFQPPQPPSQRHHYNNHLNHNACHATITTTTLTTAPTTPPSQQPRSPQPQRQPRHHYSNHLNHSANHATITTTTIASTTTPTTITPIT